MSENFYLFLILGYELHVEYIQWTKTNFNQH